MTAWSRTSVLDGSTLDGATLDGFVHDGWVSSGWVPGGCVPGGWVSSVSNGWRSSGSNVIREAGGPKRPRGSSARRAARIHRVSGRRRGPCPKAKVSRSNARVSFVMRSFEGAAASGAHGARHLSASCFDDGGKR
jgi:hypothetical protein